MSRLCRTLALAVLVAPGLCAPLTPTPLPAGERGRGEGADWPQLRGPGGMGAAPATEKGLPLAWSDDAGIAWRVQLPGPGASSPIVIGDRVLVTCYSGYGVDRNNPALGASVGPRCGGVRWIPLRHRRA